MKAEIREYAINAKSGDGNSDPKKKKEERSFDVGKTLFSDLPF